MILKTLFLPVACCIFFKLNAQKNIYPGGVKGAVQWFATDTAGGASLFSNYINGSHIGQVNDTGTAYINYHPAYTISKGDNLAIALGDSDMNSATFFTIYQQPDTLHEYHIWNIVKNKQPQLILTTQRVADLGAFKYMNYAAVLPGAPKMHIYAQQKADKAAVKSQEWNIGTAPASLKLPVKAFSGLVPEVIAFKRVLSHQERLKVASYLSLKYGITLSEPATTYVNSAGNIIWDGEKYAAYHNNIAGITRDDTSGLVQLKAESSNNPGLLCFSAAHPLSNNSSLLWGDNNMPLAQAPKIAGLPALLQKKWQVVSFGNSNPFVTDVTVNTKYFDVDMPQKPVYWMAIDSTGEGNFSHRGTRFIKMTAIDERGLAQFNAVNWHDSNAKRQVFTFIVGQDILLDANIFNPSCKNPGAGKLYIKILGGMPPFSLIVTDKSGSTIAHQFTGNNSEDSLTSITAGKYKLRVTDAHNDSYSDSFYINNSDAPHPAAVAQQYRLMPGLPLQINAAAQMPPGISYAWSGPGNFQSAGPVINVTKPGIYTLISTSNGCSFSQDVEVTSFINNISSVLIYPNPSKGNFKVKILLAKAADISMIIYATDGRTVKTMQSRGFANYLFSCSLVTEGTYYAVFQSGGTTVTKRIIIAR